MRGIRIRRLRVVDCTADGLNFHRGVSDAVVEESFWRNTGDDALAAWSHRDADHHVAFRRNTIAVPTLANGIAVYGGHDIEVSRNLVSDTLTEGGGLHLGNRFSAIPASGGVTFAHNMIVRGGSFGPHGSVGIGALWFYALDAPLTADVRVIRTVLLDSSEDAVLFVGKRTDRVSIEQAQIIGAGRAAFNLQAAGAARVIGTRVTGTASWFGQPCDKRFALMIGQTRNSRPTRRVCPDDPPS